MCDNELKCRMCGKGFGAGEVGHVDDHIEICKDCYPEFSKKKAAKEAVVSLGKHLASWYRGQKVRGLA